MGGAIPPIIPPTSPHVDTGGGKRMVSALAYEIVLFCDKVVIIFRN